MKSLKLLFRFLTVGALLLVLLVPLSLIRGTIQERKQYRAEATQRIAQSSAGEQQVIAPLRVLPWTDSQEVEYTDDRGVLRTRVDRTSGTVLQMPATLDIQGEIVPDTRRLGLFEVRVYSWRATLSATFDAPLPQPVAGVERTYGTPYLLFGVSDVRGLVGTPNLRVDGRSLRFEPGTRDYAQTIAGVSAALPAITGGSVPGRSVEMEFVLAGTESLSIVPAADSNTIAVQSKWPHPSFSGDFLPTQRKVHPQDRGFEARWDISSLASQAQGQIRRLGTSDTEVERLKIALVDPVDVYTQADRASKYGLLFVLLTFVGFALFELIKRLPIHPLQYLLVGLALAVFFLLLLSLSEHIAFWKAYLVSSVACIGLQFVYLSGVLRSWVRAAGFAAMLTALYGVLYSLLVSEDNALLMGSLLLFGILGAIMWITRRVDWYELAASLR
jgi:inner membrane protein